jgi:hypothetical protein
MYFTPHSTSAMAMFGYVYLWYLMAVLVLEIWLDYRATSCCCRSPARAAAPDLQDHDARLEQHQRTRSLAIDERWAGSSP